MSGIGNGSAGKCSMLAIIMVVLAFWEADKFVRSGLYLTAFVPVQRVLERVFLQKKM